MSDLIKVNFKTPPGDLKKYRKAAKAEKLTLSAWIRRVLWSEATKNS